MYRCMKCGCSLDPEEKIYRTKDGILCPECYNEKESRRNPDLYSYGEIEEDD